jgi:hypothetical protein
MERKAWITAVRMVQQHGADAFAFKAVESKLGKMRRDGVDEDRFRRWSVELDATSSVDRFSLVRLPDDLKDCPSNPTPAVSEPRSPPARTHRR